MALTLDHVVIAVNDLDTAMTDYRALGFTVIFGGKHASGTTQNALVCFKDGTYLELLAPTGEPPRADVAAMDFSPLLQHGEGLVGYALRSDNLEADAAAMRERGIEVGEVKAGGRKREDGVELRWKTALIDGGMSPFLIEDVTPRRLRVPDDDAVTTHPNRAVGLRGVEIAVRSTRVSWERYIRLFDASPDYRATIHSMIECVILHEASNWASNLTERDLNSFRSFPTVTQAEVDAADPAVEPQMFEVSRKVEAESLARLRAQAEQEQAIATALAERPEALFAIHLIREEAESDRFTLERTHQVRFRQLTGTLPTRGAAILVGLDTVDWNAVHHAYGAATDVPELLRELASDNATVRDNAYQSLNESITHQGTIYEASVETIPFLLQLLNAPEVEDKESLLDLLGYIAFAGLEVPALKDRTRTLLDDALPIFITQLNHPNHKQRAMIAEQLALYPTELNILEPLLRMYIASDPDSSVRAKCVRALAALWKNARDEDASVKLTDNQTAYIAGLMRDPAQPMAVQFRTACILVKDDANIWLDEALALFYRMMESDEPSLNSLSIVWFGSVYLDVITALSAHPEQALNWVIAQAKHPNPKIRQHVTQGFERLIGMGQSVTRMIPVVAALMRDPSPDVRQSAVGFFYMKPYAHEVIDTLQDLAEHDPSLDIRVVARNILKNMMPPRGAL